MITLGCISRGTHTLGSTLLQNGRSSPPAGIISIVIVHIMIGAFSSQFHSGGLEQLTEFDVFSKRVWNIKLFTVPWIVCFKSKQVVGLPPPHHHPPVYHDNVQTCPTATHTTPNCQNYRHQKFSWQKWDNFSLSNLNFNSEDYLLL